MRNTLADVIDAALRVLDDHGLEFCSMRRVAAALEVQPSALYHHVPNKQTLLALMADEIVREVRGDEPACVCRSLRESMLAIRDGADVVATASAFRLGASSVEALLASMGGADGARARAERAGMGASWPAPARCATGAAAGRRIALGACGRPASRP